ncbi:MAG: large conductance mechanosensitive channel protein MscL [Rickettsiales bacterium]|jgi:large conductance mechanosensitive channel|nr:large conductance mechanosensitive channel protein MscL [Rickettsiales bacterium]
MKKILLEFKAFIAKGSAIDMAVGIIVGSVMTGVVNSLVKDIIMPPIGLLIGGVDFSNWFIIIRGGGEGAVYHTVAAAQSAGATTLNVGLFINTLVSFFITMFAVFMIVRVVSKVRAHSPAAITTRICPYCQKSDVGVNATKCPYCLSALKPVKAAPVVAAEPEISLKKLAELGDGMIKKVKKAVKK